MVSLNDIKKVYFIGIGGSGMSSVANMMLVKGKDVFGSDRESNAITQELEKNGAKISYIQDGSTITKDFDLVVYTVAIPKDNLEFKKAEELAIPLLSYPEIIGLISKEMTTIAVSGTHGKTTTTAMLSHILADTNISPTVILGAEINGKNSNFIEGNGKYLLIEADEYRKSFLNLSPKYLIINNIDEDHLDFYKDLSDIQNTFKELVNKIPTDGFLVCNINDLHLKPIIDGCKCNIVDSGNKLPENIKLSIPGIHNRQNASSAYVLAKALGIDDEFIFDKIKSFSGVKRRFEYKGKTKNGALVYDDYAHNPQKVNAALQGTKEAYPDRKIIAVFQPHLFSRTKTLLKEFGKSFGFADEVFLAPIYPAREKFDPTINSEILSEEINKNNVSAKSYKNIDELKNDLENYIQSDDIVVFMGAGDINNLSESLIVK